MKDYDIADQRYGRSWTEHAKIETSQRTWNQGTVEGMDDRLSAWRMSKHRTGSGEAVNMLFNAVVPNWANRKRCYQLNLEL
jgi:hypothetical protein